jgi:hypothetical protein
MRDTSTEFNVEQIEYIDFTRTRPSGYYFQNEVLEVKKRILGIIPWVSIPYQPEGYRTEEKPRRWWDGLITGWWMPENLSRQELAEHREMYLQKYPRAGEEVRYKAKVYIQKRKSWHTAFFDTDEAALEFIEQVKAKSKDEFQLIQNKDE